MCHHCMLQDSPVPHAPSVPVIDLSGPDAQVAEELRKACITYGFFTSEAQLATLLAICLYGLHAVYNSESLMFVCKCSCKPRN